MRRVRALDEIGRILRSNREGKGMTRLELAQRIKLNHTTYGDYEKGAVEGGCLAIARAAVELEMSVDDILIDDSNEKELAELAERDISGVERVALKECEQGLLDLADLCRGASESPIVLFAEHIADLRKTLKESLERRPSINAVISAKDDDVGHGVKVTKTYDAVTPKQNKGEARKRKTN